MFGTMLSSSPPLLYWQPESVAIIRLCEELRQTNVPAWETMDAGPQVKILTLEEEVDRVCGEIEQRVPGVRTIVSRPGGGARVTSPGGSRAEGHAEPG
jgi:diphosphomevalonate decarboxylase